MAAEGWYHDPYGVHECRWFSNGSPTLLVRDGNEESHDPPPHGEVPEPLVPVESADQSAGDLLRADGSGDPTGADYKDRAFDSFGVFDPGPKRGKSF
jgi:hypothetical protein